MTKMKLFLYFVLMATSAAAAAEPNQEPQMRILALFSTTKNELGLDHRLGRQVLKLASQKVAQFHPELGDGKLQVIVQSDEAECSPSNELPNRVVERYYSQDLQEECARESLGSGANCSEHDIDTKQLDRFFKSSAVARRKRRWTNGADATGGGYVDAILGPSCHYLVDVIARMAAYWRLPIYSVASISAQFASKDVYPTLTRLSPSIDQLSLFIVRTMQKFNWSHLAILIDSAQIENSLMLENLERTIMRQSHLHQIKKKLIPIDSRLVRPAANSTSGKCTQEARDVLMQARRVARAVLLLVDGQQTVRQLLLCGHELGFRAQGFTFMALDLGLKSADYTTGQEKTARSAATKVGQQQNGFDWYVADDEENNALAKQMFESLIVFSVELPLGDEYNLFVEQTLDLAHQAYPQVRFDRSAVNALAVALHDSLLLAVEAHLRHRPEASQSRATRRVSYANKSSVDDADWREVSARVPLMWGEHIASASRRSGGFISTSLHINSNGDQELDYVLSDLEPELGVMRPVASFSKESRQLELLADTYVHWPKRMNTLTRELVQDSDQVPPDEPECGFDDQAEHCIDRQNLYAALTILASLVALLGLASMFSFYKYRNIKYQMQLDDYWWKINWEDLQFVQMTESLASNAQSIARAFKSGASVVSAGSDGASSYVSVMKPRAGGHALKLQSSAGQAGNKQIDSATESVVSKATKRQRRQAVPLIVTSPGGAASASDHQSEVHDDARSAMTKTSGSLLAAGSVLIRSEYSSVVRASNLAMYKDELVIVKQLNAEQIEVSRELLVELKSIRELVNDNLARFVGLCLDSQRLAIVYEFCSRGSLQDLILNKDVAIDLTLKYSIIGDIVNGLSFIHTTLLDYHGRLKSTNLVLDGRFTVKITDFGLQNLYSQLDLVQNQTQDEEEDDDEENDEDDANHRKQHDAISLSVSQSAYNMESVSMIGTQRRGAGPGSRMGGSRSGHSRVRLRNRGAARFFWTAPEHLREKNSHFAGSKKGDIYSLSIILLELFTRREPYYYGTNAQPHWPNINRDRRIFMQQQQQQQQHQQSAGSGSQQQSAGSRLLSSVSRRTRTSQRNQLGSEVSASVVTSRRPSAVGRLRHPKRNSVMPAPVEADAISVISGSAISHVSSATRDQPPFVENERHSAVRMSVSGFADQEEAVNREEEEEDEVRELSAPQQKATSGTAKRLDAEEILDQLRMGVQPEPVRPYVPNYVAHSLSPKLIELLRACWHESSQVRPPLAQIRTQLRKISRGLASRNYLDNLLDRLQNYAADLERIVDSKSADIMGEKLRTEELLYQLVPKFVAERLKRSEPIIPQVFDGVTIFFSDIVGFEKYASVMSPTELVDLLNSVYSSFDSIISSFDVTKIETIIDQFLVAAGISFQRQEQQQQQAAAAAAAAIEEPSKEEPENGESKRQKKSRLKKIGLLGSLGKSSHASQDQADGQAAVDAEKQPQQSASDSSHYRRSSAEQIGRMALCIRDLVKSFHFRQNLGQSQASSPLGSTFNIRIGIHSGKVCAGIVGVKRPKFCLIGDTVNVASRMHTNSKANRIQISDDTRQLLEQVPGFSIEPRGKIEVKGKGQMETYWLESSY